MTIILADDFSGAAEMGGIGHRYGLTTKIQLDPVIQVDAELLVIDTNTRSLNEESAVAKTKKVIAELKRFNKPFRLFKKVDSVMRGHIAAEITVLQQELGYNRILLLPANPARGRTISSGHYYINGTSLDKTVFANDPDFPISSSSVETLLKFHGAHPPYIHLQQNSDLPASSFITGDVETKEDIKNYIKKTNEQDLCCGAAECFEAWLEHLGYSDEQKILQQENKTSKLPFAVIINGSTVKDNNAVDLLEKYTIPQLSLPGAWQEDRFKMTKEEETIFNQQALELLEDQYMISITVDQPLKQVKDQPDIFSGYFVKLMHYISNSIGMNIIHFGLTGGATSFALINSTGIRDFYVKEEVAPGIVTLKSKDETKGLFTVKPGSYPWPLSFLEKLAKQ
ncbi:MAG: four-carbon acid sugar kinase family protein [Chitinophagaceae bacterium]